MPDFWGDLGASVQRGLGDAGGVVNDGIDAATLGAYGASGVKGWTGEAGAAINRFEGDVAGGIVSTTDAAADAVGGAAVSVARDVVLPILVILGGAVLVLGVGYVAITEATRVKTREVVG